MKGRVVRYQILENWIAFYACFRTVLGNKPKQFAEHLFGSSGRLVHVHHHVKTESSLEVLLRDLNALRIEIETRGLNRILVIDCNLTNFETVQ